MNYAETIAYLYASAPLFQNIGAGAYKEGLSTTQALDRHFGHPHRRFRSIHIAGTNGKGSCAHTLAAILQAEGHRVGLYTSPHLVDFRERIRVNGACIPEERVIRFVEQERAFFEPLYPSFFELTTTLAFQYFAEQQVDYAVIEVGLGGRIDCTNIIMPILSVITNISLDHTQFLGHTLAAIAGEKAGVIKSGIPVVVGEATPETRPVFQAKADAAPAPITFAEDDNEIIRSEFCPRDGHRNYQTCTFGALRGQLGGLCQEKNTNTILHAVKALRQGGLSLSDDAVRQGFAHVCQTTGLMGRWQSIPTIIKGIDRCLRAVCDTGHNPGGMQYLARQLQATPCRTLRVVIGMVNDKDVNGTLALLPKKAVYYFTRANVARALDETELSRLAKAHGLEGKSYPNVATAYEAAVEEMREDDFLFVGGSNFIIADLFAHLQNAEA